MPPVEPQQKIAVIGTKENCIDIRHAIDENGKTFLDEVYHVINNECLMHIETCSEKEYSINLYLPNKKTRAIIYFTSKTPIKTTIEK